MRAASWFVERQGPLNALLRGTRRALHGTLPYPLTNRLSWYEAWANPNCFGEDALLRHRGVCLRIAAAELCVVDRFGYKESSRCAFEQVLMEIGRRHTALGGAPFPRPPSATPPQIPPPQFSRTG